MSSASSNLRRRVLANWARWRGRLPARVQDACFHLPVRAETSTPGLCARLGLRVVDLGPRGDRLPERLPLGDAGCVDEVAASLVGCADGARAFAAEIPEGRVLGLACSAIAPDASVLVDVSPHWGVPPDQHRALSSSIVAAPPTRLRGTSALVGAIGHRNFYHWMYDVLPRIGLLREAGLPEPDRWIVAEPAIPVALEMLGRAGIPPDRIHAMRRGAHVACDRLLVTSAPGEICQPVPRSARFVRETLAASGTGTADAPPAAPRRLAVPRRGRRKIANDAALRPVLERAGFVEIAMEGLALDEQIAAFRGAEVVVAPHGAALAHLPHAARGAAVLEVLPPGYTNPSYLMLAGACGFRYGAIRGAPLPGGSRRPSDDDFTIDPATFAAAISAACAAPAP
ncbi:MAG: hypothetical protein RIS86_978, partial [Planctomycetota bacterium]|jgi:capsular polysaccharide biosynthesis protein